MYQFFVEQSQIQEKTICIIGEDVNHIKNVLRMKIGEEIAISNGMDAREYRCGIVQIDEEKIICELRFIKEDEVELPAKVYLFQGLPKSDKMEFIIQKAVELGVYQVIPMSTKRAVVKLDEKKEKSKIARWQGIAEAAAKQSKRKIIPKVTGVMSLNEAILYSKDMKTKIIAYELSEGMEATKKIVDGLKPNESIAVFIGPEGGFDAAEIQSAIENKVIPITLGKRILRTETAGFTVLAWIMYQLEN